jgi:hypothetical protein
MSVSLQEKEKEKVTTNRYFPATVRITLPHPQRTLHILIIPEHRRHEPTQQRSRIDDLVHVDAVRSIRKAATGSARETDGAIAVAGEGFGCGKEGVSSGEEVEGRKGKRRRKGKRTPIFSGRYRPFVPLHRSP